MHIIMHYLGLTCAFLERWLRKDVTAVWMRQPATMWGNISQASRYNDFGLKITIKGTKIVSSPLAYSGEHKGTMTFSNSQELNDLYGVCIECLEQGLPNFIPHGFPVDVGSTDLQLFETWSEPKLYNTNYTKSTTLTFRNASQTLWDELTYPS